jgi:magnesium-transporting ATPase (P-type)
LSCKRLRVYDEGGKAETDRGESTALPGSEHQMAEDGLRVLAFASKTVERLRINLTLMEFVGLLDPPRYDVRASINECPQSGIEL